MQSNTIDITRFLSQLGKQFIVGDNVDGSSNGVTPYHHDIRCHGTIFLTVDASIL